MNWAALIELLVKFFGPAIRDWLLSLFAGTRMAGTPNGWAPRDGIAQLFAGLRGQTWVWQLGARGRLRVLERIATAHASELYVALRTGAGVPHMTSAEAVEVAGLAA